MREGNVFPEPYDTLYVSTARRQLNLQDYRREASALQVRVPVYLHFMPVNNYTAG